MISQYIETDAGSTTKGIEIFNISGSDITFSAGNNLQVFQGTNGGGCTAVAVPTEITIPQQLPIIHFRRQQQLQVSLLPPMEIGLRGQHGLEVWFLVQEITLPSYTM